MSTNTPHHSRFFWRSSAMFCLLDARVRFTEINSAWEKHLELSTGNLLTKSFLEFLHPEDRPATQYYFEQLNEGMVATTFAARFRHRNGSYRQLLWEITVSASPEKDHAFYGVALDITGRERQSVADEIVNILPQGIVLQYANGTIGACNASAERILGLPADQMIGWTLVDPDWELLREDNSPFPSEAHPAICALRTGQPQTSVVIGVQKPDTSVFWLRMNAVPLWRDETSPYAVVISFSDVTQYKTTEFALRQQSEQQVVAAAGSATQNTDYDFWNWDLSSNQISFSPAWKTMLGYEENEVVNHLDTWYGRIHPVDYKRVVADVHNHLEGLTPQFENTHRIQHRDGTYRWVLAKGVAVRDSAGKPLRMVGMHLDITDQRRMEDRLQELQAKYGQLMEGETDGVLLVDASDPGQEKILEVNKTASQIYGYSRGEFLDMTFTSLSAQAEKAAKAARKLTKQTRQRYHRKKDDTVFPAEVTVIPFVFQGRELAFVKIRDNTEKQNIETALWESQSKYRQLFEAASAATIVFDANTQQVFDVNNVAVDMYGYTKEEWLNLTTESISAEPSKSRSAIYTGNKKQLIPLRWHRKKDGTVFPVEISVGNTYLFQGRSLVCATLRDITERKASEEELRKERDFVHTLVQASPTFFFAVSPDGRVRMINDAMLKAVGYELNEVVDQNYIHMLVADSEQAMVSAEFENLSKSMRPSVMEYQVTTKEGALRKVEWHSRAIVQADGSLDYIFAVGIDITERLRTQEDLRLFKTIIEASEEAISISNSEGRLIYVNPAHEKLFGQPLAEACAHNRDYYPPESLEVIKREVQPALARGESWTGELDVSDTRGNLFPVWQRADSVRDAKGAVMFTFELMHNISERKRMWETLRSQWEESQLIFNNVPMMIWHMAPDNRILRANRLATETFPDEDTVKGFFEDNADIIAAGRPDYRSIAVYADHSDTSLWLDTGRIPYRNSDGEIVGLIMFALDITAYKQSAETRTPSRDKQTGDLLFKLPLLLAAQDEQGRIVAWNKTAEAVTGYSVRDLQSDPGLLEKLYPDANLRHQMLSADKDYRDLSCPITTKEGESKQIEWTSLAHQFPVSAWHTWQVGVVAAGGLAHDPLALSVLMPYLFENSRLGICLTDDRGRFLKVNPAYADMYGYTPEELVGQPFTVVLPATRHDDAIREYFSMLITHEDALISKQLGNRHRKGEFFDVGLMTNRVLLRDGRRLLITVQTKLPEDF